MTNEDDTRDAEVVEEPKALSLAHPAVPVTIEDLAADDKGVALMERRGEILAVLRITALKLTMPSDWVLFKTPDGIVTGFLSDTGCDRVKKLFGIQVENIGKMELIEDSTTHEFAYSISGEGHCRLTGEHVYDMTGTRYSTEPFAQQKPDGIQRHVAVQKAARANLDGGITRELAGLKSIPVEELEKAWVGSWKKWEMCSKGRGFGSGAERQGAQVQQSSDIPQQFQPKCDACHEPMKFIKAGQTAAGKPYEAFWACAKNREHKPNVTHKQALAEAQRMQAEAKEPGSDG